MIRSIGHITLSVLLLLSATGVSVNMHYCHDKLIDLAFMAPARSCCTNPGDRSDLHQGIERPGHCKDQSVHFEATSDFVVTACSVDLDNSPSSNLLFSSPLTEKIKVTAEVHSGRLLNFKKPPTVPEVDLPEIQTFLI